MTHSTAHDVSDPRHNDEALLNQAAEAQATQLEHALFENKENMHKTAEVIASFVASCQNRGEKPLEQWLSDEFRKYPSLWESEEEILATTRDIIQSVGVFNEQKESHQRCLDQGRSSASWLAKEIEKGAAATGAVNVGQYASQIDQALSEANTNAQRIITTQTGAISMNPNLDGFIAEQHHVDTFNIDAATKGSPYRAELVNSRDLNSVDIQIVDADGNVVAQYQSKYGATPSDTAKLLERGDYGDQQPLVPEGHSEQIANSAEVIEIDGVKSQPLSKEEAKALQEKAQQEQEARQYDWSDTNRLEITKQIGKQALISACITAGLQGTRILARRAWNFLNGRKNPSVDKDLREFFQSTLRSTKHTSVQIAVSGGVVVAVKNGWLGAALRGTPAGLLANIACIGLQNAKTLYKLGKGELSQDEALDTLGHTTTTAVGALMMATKGASLGAAVGAVLGPVGAAVGGFVGGVAGGIAGSEVGEAVYIAGKAIAKKAIDTAEKVKKTVKQVGKAAVKVGKEAWKKIKSLF